MFVLKIQEQRNTCVNFLDLKKCHQMKFLFNVKPK